MTDLTALTRICPAPRPAMHIAWEHVESALSMALPTDYKRLAEHCGPDAFCSYIHIYHPHGPTEFVNLTGPMPARIRAYLRKDFTQGTHPPSRTTRSTSSPSAAPTTVNTSSGSPIPSEIGRASCRERVL